MLQKPDIASFARNMRAKLVHECDTCQGTGFLVEDEKHTRCHCIRRMGQLIRLHDGNVPERYWDVLDWEFEWSTQQRNTVAMASMKEQKLDGTGWLMFGDGGTGKTACACFWLARAAKKWTVGYVTAQEYVSSIIRSSDDRELGWWVAELERADFMVIDELGREHSKGKDSFSSVTIDSLVRNRAARQQCTTICTDLTLPALQQRYPELLKAINNKCEPLRFEETKNAKL